LLGLVTCECCDKIMRRSGDLCGVRKHKKNYILYFVDRASRYNSC
jgi:hypothetical protein